MDRQSSSPSHARTLTVPNRRKTAAAGRFECLRRRMSDARDAGVLGWCWKAAAAASAASDRAAADSAGLISANSSVVTLEDCRLAASIACLSCPRWLLVARTTSCPVLSCPPPSLALPLVTLLIPSPLTIVLADPRPSPSLRPVGCVDCSHLHLQPYPPVALSGCTTSCIVSPWRKQANQP